MKCLLKINLFLLIPIGLMASPSDIKPSKAILESNVGEMEVKMQLQDDGLWKLTSLLMGDRLLEEKSRKSLN